MTIAVPRTAPVRRARAGRFRWYAHSDLDHNTRRYYTFSFWLNAVGDDPSDFSAYWDGAPALYSQSDPNTGNAWTQFSFNVTGTGSDTIEFDFRDDPAYIALDNVSVDSSTATPEPGTLPLILTGSLALAGFIRRKSRAGR